MKVFLPIVLIALLSLAVAYRGDLIGIQDGFASTDIEIEGRSFSVLPLSGRTLVGNKFGFPVFETKNTFFVDVRFKCGDAPEGIIEISKESLAIQRWEKIENWGICYVRFRSTSTMTGKFFLDVMLGGHVRRVEIELMRRRFIVSPFLDAVMSI